MKVNQNIADALLALKVETKIERVKRVAEVEGEVVFTTTTTTTTTFRDVKDLNPAPVYRTGKVRIASSYDCKNLASKYPALTEHESRMLALFEQLYDLDSRDDRKMFMIEHSIDNPYAKVKLSRSEMSKLIYWHFKNKG